MSVKLDGKSLAKRINKHTAYKINNYRYYQRAINHKQTFTPTLATVLVGDDPASKMYVRMKGRKARELGIRACNVTLDKDCSQSFLNQTLDNLSQNPKIDGILLQLPLPKTLDAHEASLHIFPSKDADGVNPLDIGTLAMGVDRSKHFYPIACTPRGIMTILYTDQRWHCEGLEATIVGRSDIVGRPLALMLINAGAEVKVINSHVYHTHFVKALHNSQLIVSATGHGNLIKSDDINPNAVIIDAGIDHDRNGHLIGDVSKKAKEKSLGHTPVPGGVGPMTIAMLMRQTYELAVDRRK